MHLGHTRDRSHHRDGRLTATGDHVDVGLVDVLFQVYDRHAVGADGRRGQIDDAQARLVTAQKDFVVPVGTGRSGIEDKVDVGKLRHLDQPIHPFVGGGHAHARSTRQAIGFGVDTDHGTHGDMLTVTQNLDHQVGADVARADDRSFQFLAHCLFPLWE